MIRYNRHRNKIYFDHSELLSDPNIRKIVGKPRVRSQPPMPAPTTPTPSPRQPAPEDPAVKFDRMVKQLMDKGLSYTESVKFVDSIDPTLRERAIDLANARRDVAAGIRRSQAAAVRANRVRRFNARRGVR